MSTDDTLKTQREIQQRQDRADAAQAKSDEKGDKKTDKKAEKKPGAAVDLRTISSSGMPK